MTKTLEYIGVIDKEKNPFIRSWWIKQGCSFILKRQKQFSDLIGKDKDTNINVISNIRPENYGKYVAFVAIRWGFATIKENKLVPTEKWLNRNVYNNCDKDNNTSKPKI